jgi:hypothetical protein
MWPWKNNSFALSPNQNTFTAVSKTVKLKKKMKFQIINVPTNITVLQYAVLFFTDSNKHGLIIKVPASYNEHYSTVWLLKTFGANFLKW